MLSSAPSRLIEEIHFYLRLHEGTLRERIETIADELRSRGIEIPLRIEQLALTPAIIDHRAADCFERSLRQLFSAIRDAVRERFDSDARRLAEYLQMTDWFREADRCGDALTRDDWDLAARPDVVIASGMLSVLETNLVPLFGHQSHAEIIYRALTGIAPVKAILDRFGCIRLDSLDALASRLRATVPGIEDRRIAAVEWQSDLDQAAFVYQHLAAGLSERGLDTVVRTAEDVADGGDVNFDVIYRFFKPPQVGDSDAEAHYARLLDLAYDRGVHLIGHVGQEMFSAKALQALVSEAAPPASALASIVPWTRIVQDGATSFRGERWELPKLLSSRKDLFIIKRSVGYGGIGALVGRDATDAEWEAKVAECLVEPRQWVVQEWVDSAQETLAFLAGDELEFRECHVDYGLFMFGGTFAGGMRRNTGGLSTRLTHMSQGGGVGPLLVRAT